VLASNATDPGGPPSNYHQSISPESSIWGQLLLITNQFIMNQHESMMICTLTFLPAVPWAILKLIHTRMMIWRCQSLPVITHESIINHNDSALYWVLTHADQSCLVTFRQNIRALL
jgi:hypothetical protein